MRAALLEAARARKPAAAITAPTLPGQTAPMTETVAPPVENKTVEKPPEPPQPPAENPLKNILNGGLESLLSKCFRRSEASFEKLSVDIARTDAQAPIGMTNNFDAGLLLDTLQQLTTPMVIIHGTEDPIIPPPGEDVWSYITKGKENLLLPIPLPGVRHFPMLEDERFLRIVNDFLELPDISRIEVKERWRRRTR
jgi:pimeloyl-ACP methyl ester carboxylesterase